jgi:hypothetical protein
LGRQELRGVCPRGGLVERGAHARQIFAQSRQLGRGGGVVGGLARGRPRAP